MSDRPVRVLLVDDSDTDAQAFRVAAETVIAGSLRLERCTTAYQAMQTLRGWPLPHVIVVDLRLAGEEDGTQLASDIAKDPRLLHVPIFTWSADVEVADYGKSQADVLRLCGAVLRAAAAVVPGPLETLHENQLALAGEVREVKALAQTNAQQIELGKTVVGAVQDDIAKIAESVQSRGVTRLLDKHPWLALSAMVLIAVIVLSWGSVAGAISATVGEWFNVEYTSAPLPSPSRPIQLPLPRPEALPVEP